MSVQWHLDHLSNIATRAKTHQKSAMTTTTKQGNTICLDGYPTDDKLSLFFCSQTQFSQCFPFINFPPWCEGVLSDALGRGVT